VHTDWLGTRRVMTNLTGTATDTCTGLPFGDGINCVGTEWNFNRFTDYVHDSESNLEHTPSRQYSSTQGRFLSPDPSFASIDLANPQSINRYPYVGGNPINFTDPSGLQRVCTLVAGTGDEVSFCINIGPDMVDGQSLQDPFGAGSGGFGGSIGDIIGKILGGGGLAGNTVPGNCFLPGACPSLPIPSILDFLPHIPRPGCDPGPCSDGSPGALGNGFAQTSVCPLAPGEFGPPAPGCEGDAVKQENACSQRNFGVNYCALKVELCILGTNLGFGRRGDTNSCANDWILCMRAVQELTPDCKKPI